MNIGHSSVTINRSTFFDNAARSTIRTSGGVIIITQASNLTISDSQFVNNTAEDGGVLTVAGKTSVSFKNCIFAKNRVTRTGGVLLAVQSEIVFCGTCNLTDNNADNGGGIYAIESTLNIYDEMKVMFNKEGMDTYWKTWVQLAFPTYIIFLVVGSMIQSNTCTCTHTHTHTHLLAIGIFREH